MKISLEQSEGVYTVHSYSEGTIRIRPPGASPGDDDALILLQTSCILGSQRLVDNWSPQSLAELTAEHLQAVEEMQPELLLIGCGDRMMFPGNEQRAALVRLGIGHEVMDTGAACRTYNVLVSEGRKVVAVLFT